MAGIASEHEGAGEWHALQWLRLGGRRRPWRRARPANGPRRLEASQLLLLHLLLVHLVHVRLLLLQRRRARLLGK